MTTPHGRPTRAELLAGRILALDPGVEHPACAVFDRGELQVAERVPVLRHRELARLDQTERCRRIAELIEVWALQHGCESLVALVVELPQVYSVDKAKGDPNKLMPLAMIGSSVASLMCVRTISPLPKEWIGSITKAEVGDPWASARGKLIARRLKEHERARVQSTHDAIDAAGIGLWLLGRLDRVFPGTV